MTAQHAFRYVLRLYPADFRARFEPEMLATVTAALTPTDRPLDYAARIVREAASLAAGAAREWVAKLAGDSFERARVLPDCRLMRPVGVTRAEWATGLAHIAREGGA